jgi:cell wall-associated NlpC family hydrolase
MRVKSASLAAILAAIFAETLPVVLTGVSGLALVGCAVHPTDGSEPSAPARGGSAGESPAASAPAVSSPADPRALMVASATAMLGQPYRFGGAAPGGFDCSGLVTFAAQSAGLNLPRTAKDQLRTGSRVGRDDLEPGDLVFMRLAHKELHVGIVVDGERFIHAPSRGGRVRIDSLAAPPYSAGFLGARRVIGGIGRASGR